MAFLNYSTEIAAHKSAAEIQRILIAKGATSISVDYEQGDPSALTFKLKLGGNDIVFRLPSNWEGVFNAMKDDRHMPPRFKTKEQAKRVSWRVLKDWVEAQLAIIESGQAKTEEVFLPYALTNNGQTLFQRIQDNPSRLLTAGDDA